MAEDEARRAMSGLSMGTTMMTTNGQCIQSSKESRNGSIKTNGSSRHVTTRHGSLDASTYDRSSSSLTYNKSYEGI